MNTLSDPLFFKHINEFINAIPEDAQALSPPNKAILTPLLDDYLRYYTIASCAQDNSARHSIWQSRIQLKGVDESYRIVQQYWQPQKPKGTVVIAHGYFDHTGFYGRVIHWALSNHYTVLCFDLPGHGLSSGERAGIKRFSDYSDIFQQILIQQYSQGRLTGPVYALGQSTGCAIITDSLLSRLPQVPTFEHVFLLAPLIRIHGWPLLRWLHKALKPCLNSLKRTFIASSHDKDFNQFLRDHDPLQARRIPLNWLSAMDHWYQFIKRDDLHGQHLQQLTIIQGNADGTVDWKYNLTRLQQLFPNSQAHMVNGAKHHLVKESHEYWTPVEQALQERLDEDT